MFTEYAGDDPLGFVTRRNLLRRHLSTAQRSAIAADLANMRREDTLKQNAADPSNEGTVTTAAAAEVLGVSVSSVERAKKVKKEDPEAHEAAKRGEKKPKKKTAPKKATKIEKPLEEMTPMLLMVGATLFGVALTPVNLALLAAALVLAVIVFLW